MGDAKVTTRDAKRLATRERLFDAAVAEFKRTGVAAGRRRRRSSRPPASPTARSSSTSRRRSTSSPSSASARRSAWPASSTASWPRPATLKDDAARGRPAGDARWSGGSAPCCSRTCWPSTSRRPGPSCSLWPDHPLIARVIAEFERARDRGEISTRRGRSGQQRDVLPAGALRPAHHPRAQRGARRACSSSTSPPCSGGSRPDDRPVPHAASRPGCPPGTHHTTRRYRRARRDPRLALAWGICAVVVVFWYYIMSRLGTF